MKVENERIEKTTPQGLTASVVRFAGFLKARGFRVFQSGIEDSLLSLSEIDLSNRQDFISSLRANLVSNDVEWAQFADLFEEFWGLFSEDEGKEEEAPSCREERNDECGADVEKILEIQSGAVSDTEPKGEKNWLDSISYSPVPRFEKKDFACFDKSDIQVAQLVLKNLLKSFTIQKSRRFRSAKKGGEINFPRIMKRSLKSGGLPLELFYRKKKRRLKRLVILADVSGSMDRYARFVMPFLLSLRGIGPRAEVFAFSTSLVSITFLVRHSSIEKALRKISQEVPDWSGGTRIGHSLWQFNEKYGQRLLNRRTIVVLLSDGWDLGGKELLKREMETLSRKAHSVIWLNPLAGDPEYQPICQGMKVALPYVDHFLSADSLHSLKRVGRLLSKMMVH